MNSSGKTKFSSGYGLLTIAFVSIVLLSPAAYASATPSQAGLPSPPTTPDTPGTPGTAGYFGSFSTGVITKATAKWNVPPVTCQPGLQNQTLGVGIEVVASGGVSLAVILQVVCPHGHTTPIYDVEAIFYPTDSKWVVLKLTVSPGDALSASITVNPLTNKIVGKVTDLTTSLSAKHSAVVSGASTAYSAWWTISTDYPSGPLAAFTTPIKFTACSVVHSGTKLAVSKMEAEYYTNLIDGSNNLMASVSALASKGTSFTVTFVSST